MSNFADRNMIYQCRMLCIINFRTLFNSLICNFFYWHDPFAFRSRQSTTRSSAGVRSFLMLHTCNHLQHNCYFPTASSRVIKEIRSSLITRLDLDSPTVVIRNRHVPSGMLWSLDANTALLLINRSSRH